MGLTFITNAEPLHGKKAALYKCSCGKEKVVRVYYVEKGKTNSCGNCDSLKGEYNSIEYKVWRGMRSRCNNPNASNYYNYGAKGIKVCEEWNDFNNFLNDMGRRPTKNHSIDRINNLGDYCKENCKWSTKEEQARNRCTNINLTFNNKTQTIQDWSKELKINDSTLEARFHKGWSTEKILTTPPKKYRPSIKINKITGETEDNQL